MSRATLINRTVGGYHLVDFLGAGGMGEVYRGVHDKIGREAAIKVMTQAAPGSDFVERFFNEARIQAHLSHPNIATLYDFLEFDGQPCIVMEHVDGQTLSERIRPYTPLPLAETIYVFQRVVEAVGYVHGHGIVHRDIKSNNIKISSRGEVKLLDFGIAKAPTTPGLTATGSVVGTLEYLSPEQIRGGVADARSDIWALGVLLYEMATARLPFHADTLGDLCDKIGRAAYTPPCQFDASVPREVEAIINRCLKRNPAERYQSAQELLRDASRLSTLVTNPAITDVAPGPGGGDWPSWARQHWKVLAGAGAAVAGIVFLVAATTGIFMFMKEEKPAGDGQTTAQADMCQPPSPANANTGDPRIKPIVINTYGGQAEVYREGRLIGKTPCALMPRLGERFDLTFKRDGVTYKFAPFTVTPNKADYSYELKREYIYTLREQ